MNGDKTEFIYPSNKLGDVELHIGLLEKDVAQLNSISERVMISIEKIQDVSNKLLQVIALQEQRLAQTEESHKYINTTVERRNSEIDIKIKNIDSEINNKIISLEKLISEKIDQLIASFIDSKTQLQDNLDKKEKWLWAIAGSIGMLMLILSGGKLDYLVHLFHN